MSAWRATWGLVDGVSIMVYNPGVGRVRPGRGADGRGVAGRLEFSLPGGRMTIIEASKHEIRFRAARLLQTV